MLNPTSPAVLGGPLPQDLFGLRFIPMLMEVPVQEDVARESTASRSSKSITWTDILNTAAKAVVTTGVGMLMRSFGRS